MSDRVNTEYGSLPISDLDTQDLIDGIRDALSELHREPVWECHGCDAQNLLDELAKRLAAAEKAAAAALDWLEGFPLMNSSQDHADWRATVEASRAALHPDGAA